MLHKLQNPRTGWQQILKADLMMHKAKEARRETGVEQHFCPFPKDLIQELS